MAACGTHTGYTQHLAAGEEADDACKEAHNAYVRASASNRAYQRARQRAMSRLVALHRGQFAALLAEERAREEANT
jgi:hypothetical protein